MSPLVRVFLSYATACDLSSAAVEKLYGALTTDGHSVFLDKKIRVGQQWRREIDVHLDLCDAAVLFVSPRAVEDSAWCLKEATILSWRRSRSKGQNPRLFLVPIVIGDPQFADTPFGALDLADEQYLRGDGITAGKATVEQQAEALAGAAREALEEAEPVGDSNLSDSALRLRRIVSRLEPEVQRRVASVAGLDSTKVAPERLAEELALRILEVEVSKLPDVVRKLGAANGLKDIKELIRRVEHLWVDPDCAQFIRDRARDPNGVALNTDRRETTEHCLRRATGVAPYWEWLDAGTLYGERDEHGLEQEYRAALVRLLRVDSSTKDRDLHGLLRRRLEREPVFARFPHALCQDDNLAQLVRKVAPFTPLLEAGPEATRSLGGASLVDPRLDPDREDEAYYAVSEAKSDIERIERDLDIRTGEP